MDTPVDVQSFVAGLRGRGVDLSVDGERLVVSPASSLSTDDASFIRAHKPAIVALLTTRVSRRRRPFRPDCISCGAPLTPQSAVRCPTCVYAAHVRFRPDDVPGFAMVTVI